MSTESKPNSSATTSSRGRGRGCSRGGFGKYLRARGRRGAGRPAEFRERLVLEGEQTEELDEEEAAEIRAKYARRQLGTNADRYAEPEPELGSDGTMRIMLSLDMNLRVGLLCIAGEPIVEPEVDLSSFLERQRLADEEEPSLLSGPVGQPDDEDDVDHSLDHITSGPNQKRSRTIQSKGKTEMLEWNEELESMAREKAAAEATWDLKERFRAKSEKLKSKPVPSAKERKADNAITEAPALPSSAPPKDPKAEMQDFLDDLLG
ncbi:hypothetical protein NP233_g5867 [Leucocoprinus birnbaumii]|uniref:Uncharacterized protein n=1 Tax=Leucocoprinus birnbaumii TaxID=56174 RepID=A0AAD5VVJ3_9AGAR|nr:hypothetical protein NP233_g5867 [Leucocoprinus birnbaumii]